MIRAWKIPLMGFVAMSLDVVNLARTGEVRPAARRVWGPYPWVAATVLGVVAGGLGLAFAVPGVTDTLNGSSVLLATAFAMHARRQLIVQDPDATSAADWKGVAAPLVLAVLVVVTMVTLVAAQSVPGDVSGFAVAEVWAARLAFSAVLIGTLTFANNWIYAVFNLFGAIVGFFITVWFWQIGAALATLVFKSILGVGLSWVGLAVPALFDPLGDLGFMLLLYVAVIGGAWIACEGAFEQRVVQGRAYFIGTLWKLLTR